MVEPLLSVKDLVRRFGGILATDNVSLDVAQGELHAVIGPNGAGKTTLISQLTGHLAPDAGSIFLGGRASSLEVAVASFLQGLTCKSTEYGARLDTVEARSFLGQFVTLP